MWHNVDFFLSSMIFCLCHCRLRVVIVIKARKKFVVNFGSIQCELSCLTLHSDVDTAHTAYAETRSYLRRDGTVCAECTLTQTQAQTTQLTLNVQSVVFFLLGNDVTFADGKWTQYHCTEENVLSAHSYLPHAPQSIVICFSCVYR